jgi:hypothetical protein
MYFPILTDFGRLFQEIAVFPTLASYSWKTACKALNSLTVKNDPQMTLFRRKTGGPPKQNNILRSCFCAFSWLVGAQAVDAQESAWGGTLQKNSA